MHGTLIWVTIPSGQTSATKEVKTATLEGTTVWIQGAVIGNPTSAPASLKLRIGNRDIFLIRCPANDSEIFHTPFRIDLAKNETLTLVAEGNEGVYCAVIVGAG